MKFPLELEGFEGQSIIVEGPGFVRHPRILINGKQAPKGPKRFSCVMKRNDGFKILVEIRPIFLDPVPRIFVENEEIKLAKPLNAFQWIWSGIPILLIFVGGIVGGFLGAAAFWFNARIFRSNEIGSVEKYFLTGAVTVIVGFIWAMVLLFLGSFFMGDIG